MDEAKLREEICEVGRDLWNRGLVGGAEGNISCRLDDERILATPAGAIKGKMEPSDIALIAKDGALLGDVAASSEIKLHLRIYKEQPAAQAIVHAHPSVATGFALAGQTIRPQMLPEADVVLGPVILVPFAIPGTDSMGDAIAPFLSSHWTFLLTSHGAVTIGTNLQEAYLRMETLERVAKVFLVAKLLGGAMPLPPEGVRWLSDF